MPASDTIRTERADEVLLVALARPHKRNAIDRAMLEQLARVFEDAAADRGVRAIVLSGDGPVFSAGVDLAMLAEDVQGEERRPFRRTVAGMQDAVSLIERIEKPVVAAVHRYAAGLALEVALACDARIATTDCELGLPEVRLGLVPDVGGTTRLVRTVGYARAKELIMTGRMIAADRALAIGLVNDVVAPGTHVDAAAALAREMGANAPLAVGLVKRLIDLGADADKHAFLELELLVQSLLKTTDDAREGAAAILERRPPRFRGR